MEAVRGPGEVEPVFRLRTIRDRRAFYSYRAYVERVIDGDTIWLDVDCGFQVWSRQKVRLRGIDTPELRTREGQEARAFVASALSANTSVAVTTTKPDKYDRYLADLFYLPGKGVAEDALRNGRFLNGELLRKGHAKRHWRSKIEDSTEPVADDRKSSSRWQWQEKETGSVEMAGKGRTTDSLVSRSPNHDPRPQIFNFRYSIFNRKLRLK